jgi:hypothetical protein
MDSRSWGREARAAGKPGQQGLRASGRAARRLDKLQLRITRKRERERERERDRERERKRLSSLPASLPLHSLTTCHTQSAVVWRKTAEGTISQMCRVVSVR